MIEMKYTKYPYEGKNKAYIPKLIHHVSLLISKMTLVNSWQAHPRNGYEKLDAKTEATIYKNVEARIQQNTEKTTQNGSNCEANKSSQSYHESFT